MKKHLRWLGACTALLLAVFVMSCDDGPTTVPDGAETPAPTAAPDAAAPMFDLETAAVLNCMGDEGFATVPGSSPAKPFVQGMQSATDLNCTSNDVSIALADIDNCVGCTGGDGSPGNPYTCVEGSLITISGSVELQSTAEQRRSDIGWWIASDGGTAISGTCQHFYFDTSGDPTGLDDLDPASTPADLCGDIDSKAFFGGIPLDKPVTSFQVICQDTDADNQLDAGACTGWKIPGDDQICPNDAAVNGNPVDVMDFVKGTLPANKAKCRCENVNFPVGIERAAKVTVVKDLVPASDPGKFDFLIKDNAGSTVATADDVGDAGSTSYDFTWLQQEEGTKNKASVVEQIGSPNPGLQFYTISYACTEANNGQTAVNGTGTGPVNLTLANNDDWTCTFKNDRIPAPTVTINKTVTTSYDRAWTWSITKKAFDKTPTEIASGTNLTLSVSQIFMLDYEVEVTPGYTDSNIQAGGSIDVTLTGNAAYQTTTFAVTDSLMGTGYTDEELTVTCPAGPHSASVAGTKVTCTWTKSFGSVTDVTTLPGDLANKAKVSLTWNSGDTDSKGTTKAVTFGSPTNETDEQVTVVDDKGGVSDITLGTADAVKKKFLYPNDLPACVPPGGTRTNTAGFTTNDTNTTGTAQHAVSWECRLPPDGCTHTQGYWKTHSEFGPAPYDDTWADVVGTSQNRCPTEGPRSLRSDGNGSGVGADVKFDDFFGTEAENICYFDAMWSKVQGNAWVQLARQYIAAQMNVVSGADDSCIASAIADAKALLAKDRMIKPKDSDRAAAINLIDMLTMYNEGDLSCADHCDDDGTSAPD